MSRRSFSHANNPDFSCDHDVVLIPFGRRSYIPAAVALYDGVEVPLDETTDRIAYRLRATERPVTLLYSGMGGPATANALEMAAANGGRRVVLFGACGGTDPGIRVGDLVAVSAAVRGEGTSNYYAPPEFPAVFDAELCVRLEAATRARRHEGVHRGHVFTTDAGYRQGPEIYDAYAGLTVAVESECAAAAVVGARLRLRIAALLFCTDNVTLPDEDDRRYRGLGNTKVRLAFENGLAAVLEVLTGS